jgi:hypothetical protein
VKSEQALFFVVALGVEHRDLHSDKARVDNGLEVCSGGLFYPPSQKKVSIHLFFISNWVSILLLLLDIYIFLFFFNLVPHHLVSLNLYIKFGICFFNFYLFLFYPFPN